MTRILHREHLISSQVSAWNFDNQNLTDASFTGAILSDKALTGSKLINAIFSSVILSRTLLDNTILTGSNFTESQLTDADLSGALISNTSFRSTTNVGFTAAQLHSTASYQSRNLSGIDLSYNNLEGWDLSKQDLSHVSFGNSQITDMDLSGSTIEGVSFSGTTTRGFTDLQLYSTASYQDGNLRGLNLSSNDLTNWNFTNQNLSGSIFSGVKLQDANLSGANLTDVTFGATFNGTILNGADTRGASGLDLTDAGSAINMIDPDGFLNGFRIVYGQEMRLWDYDQLGSIPPIDITTEAFFVMEGGSTLKLVFEDDEWGSQILFGENGGLGVQVELSGTPELLFDEKLDYDDLAALSGTTYKLFDWTNANVTGWFDTVVTHPGYGYFMTSQLATDGTVTYIAPSLIGVWAERGPVPSPGTLTLLFGAPALCTRRARRPS